MLDRTTAAVAAAVSVDTSLTGRRALFCAIVGATTVGLLWLAATAVPPRSVGAIAFIALFAITLPWSVIGFWNACIGFAVMRMARDPVAAVNPLANSMSGEAPIIAATAILVCIRNEVPAQIIRNLNPLIDGLVAAGVASRFHIYLLSDTSDPTLTAAEEACFNVFIADGRNAIDITYRRRAINAGFKAGNIRDFCDRWGGDHQFAITFDADSFMPADAVLRIVRIMQANPTLGILQTLAIGMPSTSAFARLFQFGMRLGMHAHTIGAAWWQGDCGPYWGHNAILRLAPFIEHCKMPILPGRGPLGGDVLSHDQVEAVLMRRAGYDVRVLPVEGMSWEENPPTLLEYISRDLRWCQGNMQYWRLLTMPGLKPVSRFQFVFAILMYLGSPAWMALLALGTTAIASRDESSSIPHCQKRAGRDAVRHHLVHGLRAQVGDLHRPVCAAQRRASYGGAARFLANVVSESLFSILLSPIMALTHTIFLFRLIVLRRGGTWNSQNRLSHAVSWSLAWTRLWPQTIAGVAMLAIFAIKMPQNIGYA